MYGLLKKKIKEIIILKYELGLILKCDWWFTLFE